MAVNGLSNELGNAKSYGFLMFGLKYRAVGRFGRFQRLMGVTHYAELGTPVPFLDVRIR